MKPSCVVAGLLLMMTLTAVSAETELTSPTVAIPSKAELLFQAGKNYQNSNQSDKAIAVFEQLVTEFPEEKWAGCALVSLGEVYLSKNEEAKAEDAWKRAAQKYPEAQFDDGVKVAPVSVFQLAFLYENKGKTEEAEKLYHEILDKYSNERAHNRRSFAQLIGFRLRLLSDRKNFSADDLAAMEKTYQEAVKDLSSKKAIESLLEILSKYPKSNLAGPAAVVLAQAYSQSGNYADAEKYLIAAQTDYADCYFPNGAQVGPLAGYFQALLYRARAEQTFARISQQYPDAIDLEGRPLQALIREAIQPVSVLRPATEGIPVHRPVKSRPSGAGKPQPKQEAPKSSTPEAEKSK
jgi:TolA-binding protein